MPLISKLKQNQEQQPLVRGGGRSSVGLPSQQQPPQKAFTRKSSIAVPVSSQDGGRTSVDYVKNIRPSYRVSTSIAATHGISPVLKEEDEEDVEET